MVRATGWFAVALDLCTVLQESILYSFLHDSNNSVQVTEIIFFSFAVIAVAVCIRPQKAER